MNKLKNTLLLITGAIGAFLMLIIQSKNRKIEKQQDEIKSKDQQIKTKEFINDENNRIIINKDNASSMSDDDVTSVFKQTNGSTIDYKEINYAGWPEPPKLSQNTDKEALKKLTPIYMKLQDCMDYRRAISSKGKKYARTKNK